MKYWIKTLCNLRWNIGWAIGLLERLRNPSRQLPLPQYAILSRLFTPPLGLAAGHPAAATPLWIVDYPWDLVCQDGLRPAVVNVICEAFAQEPTALSINVNAVAIQAAAPHLQPLYHQVQADQGARELLTQVTDVLVDTLLDRPGSRLLLLSKSVGPILRDEDIVGAIVYGPPETVWVPTLVSRVRALGTKRSARLRKAPRGALGYCRGWESVYGRYVTRAFTMSYVAIKPTLSGGGVGMAFCNQATSWVLETGWPVMACASDSDGLCRADLYCRKAGFRDVGAVNINGVSNRIIIRER